MELIRSILEGIIFAIPSKRNRSINQKIKLLKQEKWYQDFIRIYGNVIIFNPSFRNFLYQKDIKSILREPQEFQRQLIQLLRKENV